MVENFVNSKSVIEEILKTSPDYVSKLYIADNIFGDDIQRIIELAKKKKVAFVTVPKQKILQLYNKGYTGLLLALSPVKYWRLDEWLKYVQTLHKVLVVILDQINDPQNFGAILRSAAAFNVDGVIIQQWHQVPVTQAVIDTSRGGVYSVKIVKVKNVYNAVKNLKKNNFFIYGTVPSGVVPAEKPKITLETVAKQKYVALIFGNEHKGIRKNILSECDDYITIEHSEKVQSLNVSVTCGIVLYEIYKTNLENR